ncbi:MAG: class I mannose-6-phosphate isomerase [Phycisphaerales bacterium]|nr:class I mannose-6-phosphate isomerase [Phycisphaerales bacterium]
MTASSPSAAPPQPLVFEPILKARPWGGDRLASLLGKHAADAAAARAPIGESWELVSLPGEESRVARGPLVGTTLADIVAAWGPRLTGAAALADGRFPLLIKFLDARENLSIQVHPKPAPTRPAGAPAIKHEAWFVIAAEPGSKLYIGEKPGVTLADFRAAAGTAAMVPLLRAWPAKPGQCFYLPSGTPHALGAGVLVAEVQTPSDTTYRLYDWDRLGLDGRPRELHVAAALENLLLGVPESEILQPRRHVGSALTTVTHICRCERFVIDRLRILEGTHQRMPHLEMAIWIVLAGGGVLRRKTAECTFQTGDVVLIPAESAEIEFEAAADCDILEVLIPIASSA